MKLKKSVNSKVSAEWARNTYNTAASWPLASDQLSSGHETTTSVIMAHILFAFGGVSVLLLTLLGNPVRIHGRFGDYELFSEKMNFNMLTMFLLHRN